LADRAFFKKASVPVFKAQFFVCVNQPAYRLCQYFENAEGHKMKGKNTTEAPTWRVNRKNTILAVLDVLVFILALAFHPPIETGAALSYE
jgi:hypothetical protein